MKAILPVACAWVKWQETFILRSGEQLSPSQNRVARKLGIARPERVRLLAVQRVPPTNRLFVGIGEQLGIVSTATIGMTLRYGIFIRSDHWGDARLVAHELAHVAQYERLGGICGFLSRYLWECIDPGYPFGELEQEAKRAEQSTSQGPA